MPTPDFRDMSPAAHRRHYRSLRDSEQPLRGCISAAQYLERDDVGSATEAGLAFAEGNKISKSSFWRQVRIGRLAFARLAHSKPVPVQWLSGRPMPMALLSKILDYAKREDFDPLFLLLHLEEVEGISSETFELSVAGFEPPLAPRDLVMPKGQAPSNWVLWSREMSILAAQGPAEAAIGKTFGQTFGTAANRVLIEVDGQVMQAGTLGHRAMMPASGLALPSLLTFKNPEEADQVVPRPEGSTHGILLRIICPAGVHAAIVLQETPDNPKCWVRRALVGDFRLKREMQDYFSPLTSSLASYEAAS